MLVRIVGQDIDIGHIPAVTRIFYFREPPPMLCHNDPWINVVVQLYALLDASPWRCDIGPLTIFNIMFLGSLRMNLHDGIGSDLPQGRDLSVSGMEKGRGSKPRI